ncbi:MAG: methionyl-tRNA formyltransferase [Verrucomicrobiales bacterium]|nr:methionyl-tRNA formyltransferase [Verrucomicrobiales bacterium]
MRLVFMGTGEIALPSLRWLLDSQESEGYRVVGVYTQPDKRIGRKQILTAPGVKVLAEAAGIPVYQPETLRKNEAAVKEFTELRPDLAVVMAYGQILPKAIIEAPTYACVNLHASLLPRHRGASPIQAAIRDGDAETGITLMHVVPKLDAGNMILKELIPIEEGDTGGILHDKLAELGPALLEKGLPLLRTAEIDSESQEEARVTYSGKLERDHGHLDWSASASSLERLIRAYDPWPGTYTGLLQGNQSKKLKIFPHSLVAAGSSDAPGTVLSTENGLQVSCGEGSLILQGDLQLEGRRRLPGSELLRGLDIPKGTILQ